MEREQFIEEIKTIKIEDLKEKDVKDIAAAKALLDADDVSWRTAFSGRNPRAAVGAYIYKGSFELPEDITGQRLTLFFNSIGKDQSVYINGKALTENLKDGQTGHELVLDASIVKAGKNMIAIIATPLGRNAGTDPGSIQIYRAAGKWKRKLFNGLAQAIIQSRGEAGEIELTATSPGLKPGVLKVNEVESTSRLSN